ncbi:Very-long-chain 3-oxoacyl-CoA reductase [Colletotrichum sidae]|uniref:Very-long-chain 3-oxoacyl-CoA reductase n=3 Tax=Colletotrichum orbiculare species complex TaxID=2707354 RepID=A0A4V3HSG8_COLTR|nr:Very-long-chain 3-oxoacyl-CoA reductase [Colletotrichum spinosum]TDZ35639.1 Very-long-chain 3-oxoacyl-CoA reductase [Colletotrichum trifolii]TEA18293.1 Very-long-chain 3-oxoacyl-CoA reductase [Colletotrichum sidae]
MAGITDHIGNLPQPVQLLLAGVGALFLSSKLLSYVKFLLGAFVLGGTSLRKYGKPGTWAVVTGASDGLGKEYAYQLASKGFNLVLVSRTQSKLETLAHEIEAKFSGKTQVKILAMDFARDDNADYDRLAQLISGLEVAILINNVGQSHSIPVPFLQTARDELQNIVTINCLGTLKVTQVVAPLMQQRKKGLILTMGSFAGWIPTPYLATYSGSKAFLQHWSSSLAQELKADGIDVQLVISYLITTAMSKIRRASVTIPNPRNFVRAALSKVGTGIYQNFAYTYTPWWTHALMLWLVESTIGVAHEWALWFNLKMHADIRTRALKKAAREAKKQ